MKTLGLGSTEEFFTEEFKVLNLRDARLKARALKIFQALQSNLTSCIRQLFLKATDARQAYDFF